MNDDAPAISDFEIARWFCIRVQPKREKLASEHLPTLAGVEVFFPRVRYTRRTRRGAVQSSEPLFPGYIFAKFPSLIAKQVGYTQGVAKIVRRGAELAEVPASVMSELFALAPEGLVRIGEPDFKIGQKIKIVAGAFIHSEAKIVKLAPAKQRVAVLLEFLGQEQSVEIPMSQIDLPDSNPRKRLPRDAGVERKIR